MRFSLQTAALALGAIALAAPSFATSVTGQANVSGTATVNSSGVYFGSDLSGAPNSFNVQSPNTGSFSGLTGGWIADLLGAPQTGMLSSPVTNFAEFYTPGGTITFDLTELAPGTGTLAGCGAFAIGNVCTPLNSPFTLTQEPANQGINEVSIKLSLGGDAYWQSAGTGTSVAAGIFTTQNIVPGTIPEILAAVTSADGFTDSFSATFFATPVPEPTSLVLMGVGLLGAGLIARRKARS